MTRLVALVLMSLALGSSARGSECEPIIGMVSNDDVTWEGDYFGLRPVLAGKTRIAAQQMTTDNVHQLHELLNKEKSCVAAHILLVKVTGVEYSMDAKSWAGLRVVLNGDGSFRVISAKRSIQKFWSMVETK